MSVAAGQAAPRAWASPAAAQKSPAGTRYDERGFRLKEKGRGAWRHPAASKRTDAVQMARRAAGRRWKAASLDTTLLGVIWMAIWALFHANGGAFLATTIALWYGYYFVMDGFAGGTAGKMAAGVRIVNHFLEPAGPGPVAIRCCEVFVWAALLGIGFLRIQIRSVSDGGQGFGDELAQVYVVSKRDLKAALEERAALRVKPPSA